MTNPLQIDTVLRDYAIILDNKAPGTLSAYVRTVRRLLLHLSPDGEHFYPDAFTREALRDYLTTLENTGYSVSHRHIVKSAASNFARWLGDHRYITGNPTRGLSVGRVPVRTPRVLTETQRYVLLKLAAVAPVRRTPALFAMGYWAGCRASDVSHLRLADLVLAASPPEMTVGFKNNKKRTVALLPEAAYALRMYAESGERTADSPYFFTSQRAERLTESGVHYWFRSFKASGSDAEHALVDDLTYHDLRHDFAHRMREQGWSLEEVAYYLGHTDQRGWPVTAATIRYTQAGLDDIRANVTELGSTEETSDE